MNVVSNGSLLYCDSQGLCVFIRAPFSNECECEMKLTIKNLVFFFFWFQLEYSALDAIEGTQTMLDQIWKCLFLWDVSDYGANCTSIINFPGEYKLVAYIPSSSPEWQEKYFSVVGYVQHCSSWQCTCSSCDINGEHYRCQTKYLLFPSWTFYCHYIE